jgi:hypothetical protein
MASIEARPGPREPAIPGDVEVRDADSVLKYVKEALILALDLLVVFLLFINHVLRGAREVAIHARNVFILDPPGETPEQRCDDPIRKIVLQLLAFS